MYLTHFLIVKGKRRRMSTIIGNAKNIYVYSNNGNQDFTNNVAVIDKSGEKERQTLGETIKYCCPDDPTISLLDTSTHDSSNNKMKDTIINDNNDH